MIVFSPCSNLATRHRARGAVLVLAGKRVPVAEESIEADDCGRTIEAEGGARTLEASDCGRTIDERD